MTKQQNNVKARGAVGALAEGVADDVTAQAEGAAQASGQANRAEGAAQGDGTAAGGIPAQGSGSGKVIRKRKRKHSKRNRRLKVVGIVLLALLIIAAVGAFAIFTLINSGKDNLVQEAEDIQVAEGAVTYDEGKTVTYNGHTYELNENVTSICLIGYDQSDSDSGKNKNGQADTVMVLAMDTETGKTTVISIPRNSMVDVGLYAGDAFITEETMQLCLAYSYGTDATLGSQYTTNIVQRVLYNMPISCYFTLNISGVGALADAAGGISLTPLETIPGTKIVAGQTTTLFGKNAQSYVQYRDVDNVDSPLDRQARQIQFVQTYAHQVLSQTQGGIGTILDIFNAVSEYSTTNLGVSEVTYLGTCLIQNGVTDFDIISLNGEMVSDGVLGEYNLDKQATYQTVLDIYYNQID